MKKIKQALGFLFSLIPPLLFTLSIAVVQLTRIYVEHTMKPRNIHIVSLCTKHNSWLWLCVMCMPMCVYEKYRFFLQPISQKSIELFE